eukprot:554073_1
MKICLKIEYYKSLHLSDKKLKGIINRSILVYNKDINSVCDNKYIMVMDKHIYGTDNDEDEYANGLGLKFENEILNYDNDLELKNKENIKVRGKLKFNDMIQYNKFIQLQNHRGHNEDDNNRVIMKEDNKLMDIIKGNHENYIYGFSDDDENTITQVNKDIISDINKINTNKENGIQFNNNILCYDKDIQENINNKVENENR